MATMRVAQVSRPNGPFEIVERPIPEPGAGSVRIRVHALVRSVLLDHPPVYTAQAEGLR